MKMLALVPVMVAILIVISLAIQSALAQRPSSLGVVDGQLRPCPATPNAVCSQTDSPNHRLAPVAFQGDPAEAWQRLKQAVKALPRTQIITEKDGYLHAESTSLLFRFVDDVEFLLDAPARQIHFHSASRVGHSDLGVNRQRIEAVRKAIAQPETESADRQ